MQPSSVPPVVTGEPARSMLDAPPRGRKSTSFIAITGAVLAHAALVGLAGTLGARVVRQVAPATITQMIDVELPKQPEPPPPQQKPEPEPPPVRGRPPDAVREAPPPAAAQAGQVLSANEEVVDFGDTFVAGTGSTYAGGVTHAQGTSTQAVRDARARAGGVVGGQGTSPAGDLSRAPQLAGGARWDCPFPEEADAEGIDRAAVTLRVDVGSDGRVAGVTVMRDPGTGFAREARRCALRKRWSPALDRAGNPKAGAAVVNVQFVR
ncbi:MAG TPA: energy transducer TonB [Polyangiaceae bacterium]|nr:energy transducer TonB [Polyangiaceae bacterium]